MIPVVYIGIDPGAGGGLACLGRSTTKPTASYPRPDDYAVACKMPDVDGAVLGWLRSHKAGLGGYTFVALERVGGYINRSEHGRSGAERARGSHMFNFGANFGAARMAAVAATGHDPLLVTPLTWQRGLGISPRGKKEDQARWKNRLKDLAQEMFPGVRVTLSTADALLIAEYCRRLKEGTLKEGGNGRGQ
jgi:hypothetical protein